MKKLILSVLTVAALQTAQAQENQANTNAASTQKTSITPEQMATREAAQMQKEVQLTDEQRQKVYEAALAKQKALLPLREKYATEKAEMHAEAKPIKQQYKDNLKTILTPEQQQKLEQIREERRNRQNKQKGNTAPANK
ncbi:MAG: hypothetical protein JST67_00380 [Bacteroidetes bacterium]|nr:hypothetical protein [Bacteroidota bacterium]